MKKYFLFLIWFLGIQINAQDLMRVTTQDGTKYELSVNNIKDMDFYTLEQIDFVGEWIAITNTSMIRYDIKNDGTFKSASFSTTDATKGQFYETDGTYTVKDHVLTIKYDDGSTLRIPVVESTETKIVSISGDTYYKVQADNYSLATNDNPIRVGNEGDVVKYTDRCFIDTINNMITPLRSGRGYAIIEEAETGIMKALGINVNYIPEDYIDWSYFFKKTKNEIIMELGEPALKESFTYKDFNASIQYLSFTFDENNIDEATKIHVRFFDETKRKHYCDYIEKHYLLNKTSESSKTYYDTEDVGAATIKITVYDPSLMCVIVYEDLKTTPVSVVDWTQYFKKSGEQIKAEFGNTTDITNDEEDDSYSMVYYNVGPYKYISFEFNKGFENVRSIRVSFNNRNSMQNYCNSIAEKYILNLDDSSETRQTYYDTDSWTTASIRITISSLNYISYLDKNN